MSDLLGTISWMDLTVADAPRIRDFYQQVVGWRNMPLDMGGYDDFVMLPNAADDAEPVAGICHARGSNADLPPQWLIYMIVADLAQSLAACEALGGHVLVGPRAADDNGSKMCVIRDPAGAVCALYQKATQEL